MIECFQKGYDMKKEEFVPLIIPSEREKWVGNYGVSVANGSFGGGRVTRIDENGDMLDVHFSPYASLIQGEVRGRMHCKMSFEKERGAERSPLITRAQKIECLVVEDGPESYLILYPSPEDVIARFRAKENEDYSI